jgi:hypothetical protein
MDVCICSGYITGQNMECREFMVFIVSGSRFVLSREDAILSLKVTHYQYNLEK